MSYQSIFDTTHDVCIYGSGYIGYFAALELARKGKKVALVAGEQELLWESGRAYVQERGQGQGIGWEAFTTELEKRHLLTADQIDPAGAEIVANEILRGERQLSVLLATPLVSATTRGTSLISINVATKTGQRTIKAKSWIDASENGILCRVTEEVAPDNKPVGYEQRALLVSEGIGQGKIEAGEDLALSPEGSMWAHQRYFKLESSEPVSLDRLSGLTAEVRGALEDTFSDLSLSHFSVYPMPRYAPGEESEFPVWGNLVCASPSFVIRSWGALGDRAVAGVLAAEKTESLTVGDEGVAIPVVHSLPVLPIRCDVLVAGAGTGGAIAAIAAERMGAKPVVIDQLPYAGGVGSGGLICGYCHGHEGGLFEEVDQLTEKLWERLENKTKLNSKWHHEAKKIAFEQMFQGFADRFIGHLTVYEVETTGRQVTLVRAAGPEAVYEIVPDAIVDGTGDGDIAALAGADYEFGRQEDGLPLTYTQSAVRVKKTDRSVLLHRTNYDAGWVDPRDAEDMSRARLVGLSQYQREEFSDELHPVMFAPNLGLRQSRHFRTRTRLDIDDLVNRTRFPDAIGQTASFLDTHSIDYEFEGDETIYWLWCCKNFRGILYCDLSYGLLLPPELDNVWLASRSLGVTTGAAYAMRMQRDIQRIGEVAGYAAAIAVRDGLTAEKVGLDEITALLTDTGGNLPVEEKEQEDVDPVEALSTGHTGGYMWNLYKKHASYRESVLKVLLEGEKNPSWVAALVLAMAEDEIAEERLVAAVMEREEGLPTPATARGPFGQTVDIPNWLLAITMLRRCGTAKCLPALLDVARQSGNLLNVRTAIALTVARIAPRLAGAEKAQALEVLEALVHDVTPDTFVRPSRSVYKALKGEAQAAPAHEQGADTREDHSWRIDFTVTKAAKALGVESPVDYTRWLTDDRALVRQAFRF